MIDNIRGMLLGLAVGDAVGTTNEFSYYKRFFEEKLPITDMIGGGPFDLEIGQWTDDTSMALCLADSIIETKEFNMYDQLSRYVRWWTEGYNSCTGDCFDIGDTTIKALKNFTQTKNSISPFSERKNSGNGSIMRLAPVIIAYINHSDGVAYRYAEYSSMTTHSSPQAISACKFMTFLIRNIIKNSKTQFNYKTNIELLHNDIDTCIGLQLDEEIYYIAVLDYEKMSIDDIKPTGYVVDSLQAAMFCFAKTTNFKDGVLMATNLGGDSDTIAAIYGQIAGAHYGMSNIPIDWLDKVAWKNEIQQKADELYKIFKLDSI